MEDSLLGNCQGLLRLCHPDPEVAKRREISNNKAYLRAAKFHRLLPGSSWWGLAVPSCYREGRGQGGSLPPKEGLLATKAWKGACKGMSSILKCLVREWGTPQDAQRSLSFGFISQLQEDRKAISAAVKKQKTSLCSARLIRWRPGGELGCLPHHHCPATAEQ